VRECKVRRVKCKMGIMINAQEVEKAEGTRKTRPKGAKSQSRLLLSRRRKEQESLGMGVVVGKQLKG